MVACLLGVFLAACFTVGQAEALVAFTSDRCRDPLELLATKARQERSFSFRFCPSRIWVAEDDGSSARALWPEDRGRDTESVALSPDGQRLGFVQRTAEGSEIIVRSLVTGSERRIAPPVGSGRQWLFKELAWSRDGRWLAAGGAELPSSSGSFLVDPNIALMRSDGSGFRIAVEGPGGDTSPAFSPDGRALLFVRDGFEHPGMTAPPAGIYRRDLATGAESRVSFGALPTSPGESGAPGSVRFSPDGQAIAFGHGGRVYTIGVRGEGLRDHGKAFGGGDWLGNEALVLGSVRVMLLPLVGGGTLRQLVPDPRDPTEVKRIADGTASWSPGKRPSVIPDVRAPVAQLIDTRNGRPPARSAAAAVNGSRRPPPVVSRRTLRLFAFDTAGLGRVRVALLRNGTRAKPSFRLVRSPAGFRQLIGHARPGRYQMLITARDGRRNATKRPYHYPIVLRR